MTNISMRTSEPVVVQQSNNNAKVLLLKDFFICNTKDLWTNHIKSFWKIKKSLRINICSVNGDPVSSNMPS